MPGYDSAAADYDDGLSYDTDALPPVRSKPMKKTKLQLKKLGASDLAVSGASIKTQMTTNALLFPASAADVAALAGELTTFNTAITEAETVRVISTEKTAALADARAIVETRLNTIARQVDTVANGNVTTIHAAGMAATNDPQPVTMTQVQDLKLKASDQDEELLASCQSVKGASYYRFQTCTGAAPGNWSDHLNTTKAKCKLNHTLVSGTKVYVRVCAGNGNGEGPWSDIGWKTVP